MSEVKGKFVWYELMTTDLEAAGKFYSSVVGWSVSDSGMGEPAYHIAKSGEASAAGLMVLPDEVKAMGVPPCWTGYIGVANVDETISELKAKGGSVNREPWDTPVGRMAVVADPGGAVFILFTPKIEMGESIKSGAIGSVAWNELQAEDLDVAVDFYSSMFGWTKGQSTDMGEMGLYQTLNIGDEWAVGMMKRSAPMACWGYYFTVDSVTAGAERVKAAGGQVIIPPMQVPGGSWIIMCTDPQGAYFSLFSVGP